MSEADDIAAKLDEAVNCWLNNRELLLFQRLVQIARRGERTVSEHEKRAAEKLRLIAKDMNDRELCRALDELYLESKT